MSAPVEALWEAVVCRPGFDPTDRAGLDRVLREIGYEAEDRDYVVTNSAGRLGLYRELVQGTLRGAVEVALPRAVARLGPGFERLFEAFLAERGSRSHVLREVTVELLEFWELSWKERGTHPPFIRELARHESTVIEVAASPDSPRPAVPNPLSLEAGVAFLAATRLTHYEHAIHELPEALADDTVPAARPCHLLVYRDLEHRIRHLEVSPMAAVLLERLLAGEALGRALAEAAEAVFLPMTELVLQGTAELLAELGARGVILGAPGTSGS